HADAVFACDIDGPGRAATRRFFSGPRGCEICGPCFTPDARTLFVAIQHPGEEDGSTFAQPSTRWPDFSADLPPRPSVVAISKDDGGAIGS
ncbi:MAG: alkaline phosphatase PhoX, partial [Alphaproteobacteria bacterium]